MDLTFLGIGAIIGTGIFVLTGTGALTAGPGLIVSFILSAIACGLAALAYAEFASNFRQWIRLYVHVCNDGRDLRLDHRLELDPRIWTRLECRCSRMVWILPVLARRLQYSYTDGALSGSWSNRRSEDILQPSSVLDPLCHYGIVVDGDQGNKTCQQHHGRHQISSCCFFIVVGVGYVEPTNWAPFTPFGWGGVFSVPRSSSSRTSVLMLLHQQQKKSATHKKLTTRIIGSLAVCTILYVIVAAIMTGIVPYQQFAVSIIRSHSRSKWRVKTGLPDSSILVQFSGSQQSFSS